MKRPRLLIVAGSDPSGGAGLQMDLRVATLLGVEATVVPSALTVQEISRGFTWEPVSAKIFKASLKAALAGGPPQALKIGMLGTSDKIRLLNLEISREDFPVVLDPVLRATSGLSLAQEDLLPALKAFLPAVTLFTPNLPEAAILLGQEISPGEEREALEALHALGPKAVLLKGGHAEGEWVRDYFYDGKQWRVFERPRIEGQFRGTGCFLSTAIAALLARGREILSAVEEALGILEIALRASRAEAKETVPVDALALWDRLWWGRKVLEDLLAAAEEFVKHPVRPLIPEVQSNLAYALPWACRVEEVAAFPGRIVAFGESARLVGCPRFGASSHVARIILAAMRFDPRKRAAMNIRFDPRFLEKARQKGFSVGWFSRKEEPEEIKKREGGTLSWGVVKVCETLGYVPDLIADEGDLGKEPMIRILAESPQEVVTKALALLR